MADAGSGTGSALPMMRQEDLGTVEKVARALVALVLIVIASGNVGGRTARAATIDTAALFFDGHDPLYRSPFGAVPDGSSVRVRFRTAHGGATAVTVYLEQQRNPSSAPTQVQMTLDTAHSNAQNDVWQATLTPSAVDFWGFHFLVQNGSDQIWYEDQPLPQAPGVVMGGVGTTAAVPRQARDYLIAAYQPGLTVPSWLKGAVMYQIFPDRFYNGDKKNDTKVRDAYTLKARVFKNWNTPEPTTNSPANDYNQLDYYGGDLQGIIDKLPYLKKLGVNVLYLNPIFDSGTNHGYDTADYMRIAPHFGTLKTFKTLVAKAHKDHMKVILDGVFNHTSSDSIYFNRYGHFPDGGAFQSQSSPYYGWYTFQRWPDRYSSYAGIDTLPELNESDAVKNFIFRQRNSVAQYWLKQGADGWRLDHTVGKSDAYWQEFRTAIKGRFPKDALICECDNSPPYLGIDKLLEHLFDGDMNYPFRTTVLTFYAHGHGSVLNVATTATQFLNMMLSLTQLIPQPAAYASMNVIGTHDTNRALDTVGDTVQEMKQLAAFQMTWIGMPEIYYGDEAGLTGSNGPDTVKRKPFPWSHPNKSLQGFYVKVVHLRDQNTALRDGSITTLTTDDANRVLAFLRKDSKEAVPVIVNDGQTAQNVAIPTNGLKKGSTLVDGISGKTYKVTGTSLTVHVGAISTAILTPSRKT